MSSTNASVTSAPAGTRYGFAAMRIARFASATSRSTAVPRTATLIGARGSTDSARGGVALRDPRDAVLGIRDALVIHAEEELAEGVLDALHVAQREIGVVELSFGEAFVDDAVDHDADGLGVLLRK